MPEPFIVNVADAEAPFENFGINVHVLEPGEPNCRFTAGKLSWPPPGL